MSSTALESRHTTIERWTVDRSQTTVEFEVEHFWGLHTVRGQFDRFDGSYTVGLDGPQIELVVDAASVDTGNAARDRHLQAHDFFGVAEFPLLRFSSTRVLAAKTGRVHVSGTLFAAGRSVPVDFDASVRLIEGELEVEATTTIDQSRFGMSRGPLWNIRRPVKLHVKARLAPDPPA
jgi:polyisoprenoid-binding protein YceI